MSVTAAATNAEAIDRIPVRAGSRARWGDAITEWEAYVEEKANQALVFVGDGESNDGQFLGVPYTHRFMDEYTQRQYAQLMGFIEGAREEYDNPHFAFLTLTASTTDDMGRLRAPFDHLDMLRSSWDRGVRYELAHVMNADREKDTYPGFGTSDPNAPNEWEYLQIWEPTTDEGHVPGGYAHQHVAIVCDGPPGRERFERVIRKHVEKCEWAELEAHSAEESVDVRPFSELTNPGAYLFKYLGKSWQAQNATDYERRFNAMLWETGKRRFQPSERAQRWMQPSETDAGESWRFVGTGTRDKVARLNEYEDYQDFRVAHEVTVGEWLNGRLTRPSVEYEDGTEEDCEVGCHKMCAGRCLRCGLDRQAIQAQREELAEADDEEEWCWEGDHVWEKGRCLKCGMTESDVVAMY